MKYRLNRKTAGALLYCLAFLVLDGIWLYHQPSAIVAWLILLLLLIPTVFAIQQLWAFRYHPPDTVPDYTHRPVPVAQIKENQIVFAKPGYRFRYSLVRSLAPIAPARITEVNLNTFPISFVLDAREVVFLEHIPLKEVLDFVQRNGIPVVERANIWQLLSIAYFDPDSTKEDKEIHLQTLEAYGISRAEGAKIRRKTLYPMLLNGFWEWGSDMNLFDYLNFFPYVSHKRYWWCMEIALRNLKNKASGH